MHKRHGMTQKAAAAMHRMITDMLITAKTKLKN
jgi:hypothetical protein